MRWQIIDLDTVERVECRASDKPHVDEHEVVLQFPYSEGAALSPLIELRFGSFEDLKKTAVAMIEYVVVTEAQREARKAAGQEMGLAGGAVEPQGHSSDSILPQKASEENAHRWTERYTADAEDR